MIIVTGGAGFIGSNIVKALNDKGITDILVDNLKDGTKFVNLVDLDIADYMDKEDFLIQIMAGEEFGDVEAIFHEGACSSTTEWDGKYMMDNNYQYSKELLHYCLEREIPFLYASSAATYGGRTSDFIESREYEKPLNVYGYSKFLFDEYVRQILPEANSQIVGFRYFNVYGPQEHHKGKIASIFYQLYNQIKETGKARLFRGWGEIAGKPVADGEQRRDFVYVKDVVNVNLWFWEHKAPSGIYNCGTGQAHSYNEVAKAVIAAMGTGEIAYRDFPEVLKGKYQNFTESDPTNLLAAGYDEGFHNMNEAVKEYVDFLENGGYFIYGK